MANEEDSAIQQDEREEQENANQDQEDQDEVEEDDLKWSSSSSSNSDSDYGSDYDSYSDYDYTLEDQQQGQQEGDPLLSNIRRGQGPQGTRDNTPEANFRRYAQVLDSQSVREWQDEEEEEYEYYEDLYDFPKDPENWREEDLKELWADAPVGMTKPGWDPVWADEEDWEVVNEEIREGRDPPIAPFYIPYRKPYPVIPDNHYDISNPKAVIEELDRIEEFLKWVSYIFPDGSSYEGTVWDDLAHGKGVYVGEMGLVRYEGEWLRNDMEGHGVVEVDIPEMEPLPGSKLEKKMRAEGHIFSRDFLPPEDKEWLEMDIEDSVQLAEGNYEIPFYERDTWIKEFGRKPEKGRYRYAGQWKHGRMHGCGIYEVNERLIHGRFYFGELLKEDDYGCNEEISTLHAGIAEVAAAKARMFVNKPDGMVREANGPYSDPQHPYFYEEDDVWMAPGFINQFYEVPDYWKTYVHDVDQEREMWLNSFYKAPLRLPMPAELEYWWSKDEEPEFVLINKEPEADREDPSKLVFTEDPVILHTPTGLIINYVDDEKHGLRLFWQPPLKDGEEPDPEKVQFLPLGFDEFYGRDTAEKKESVWSRLLMAIENVCKPVFNKIDKWAEEKRKDSEMKIKLYEKELELIEAELCLEEAIEEMDEELKMEEEEEAAEMDSIEEEDISSSTKEDISLSTKEDISASAKEVEKSFHQDEDDDEEEEEEEDFSEPSDFGSVTTDQDPEKNEQKGNKPRDSPFSALSLSFASCSLVVSSVPSMLRKPVSLWKKHECPTRPILLSDVEGFSGTLNAFDSISFPRELGVKGHLRVKWPANLKSRARKHSSEAVSPLWTQSRLLLHPSASASHKSSPKVSRTRNSTFQHAAPRTILDNILCLHMPLNGMEPSQHEIVCEPSLVFSEVK